MLYNHYVLPVSKAALHLAKLRLTFLLEDVLMIFKFLTTLVTSI
jgi:hypothetical protein